MDSIYSSPIIPVCIGFCLVIIVAYVGPTLVDDSNMQFNPQYKNIESEYYDGVGWLPVGVLMILVSMVLCYLLFHTPKQEMK